MIEERLDEEVVDDPAYVEEEWQEENNEQSNDAMVIDQDHDASIDDIKEETLECDLCEKVFRTTAVSKTLNVALFTTTTIIQK